MTVVDSTRPSTAEDIRRKIEALRPGDSFSIDRPLTVEEFCEYVSGEVNAELVDGVIHVMSPPSDAHEALSLWLARVLGLYIEQHQLGEFRAGRSGVRISGTSAREPDMLFFRSSRVDQMSPRGLHGAPDLAVEIVDSDDSRRDAVRKQVQYEAIGIAEYWVIDLPKRQARQLLLEEGAYRTQRLTPGEVLVAATVEGFQLEVAWLFQGPTFPSSLEVVTRLLAAG